MKTAITAQPPITQPATRVRWLIVILACATSWLLYLHRYSWGVIKPALQQEYPNLSKVDLGWLDSVFMATYAFGQVPTGLIGDVFGPRMILSVLILLWSLMLMYLGVAHGFPALGFGMGGMGLAQAGAYPNLSKVTRSWFPLGIRTSVQGTVTASGRAGGACASLIVGMLLMGLLGLSWRSAVLVVSGLGIAFAVVFWLFFRDTPRQHPWANAAEQAEVDEGEVPVVPGVRPVLSRQPWAAFSFTMLLVTVIASTFVDPLYVFWVPMFLKAEKGLSNTEMGFFGSLPLLGGAIGGICGGMLNDVLIRITGRRRLARSAVGGAGKLLAALLLTGVATIADGRLAMVVLLFGKFFADWSQPTVWGTITDIGGRGAGTVFGIVNTAGTIAAVAAGPVIGNIVQQYGWETLFYVLAGLYLVAAAAWIFIDCTRRIIVERNLP
jgi:sugar phosphate permease